MSRKITKEELISHVESLTAKCEELMRERDEARKRVEELEKESFSLAANQCHAGYGGEYGHHRCAEIDRLTKERDELNQELSKIRAEKALNEMTRLDEEMGLL